KFVVDNERFEAESLGGPLEHHGSVCRVIAAALPRPSAGEIPPVERDGHCLSSPASRRAVRFPGTSARGAGGLLAPSARMKWSVRSRSVAAVVLSACVWLSSMPVALAQSAAPAAQAPTTPGGDPWPRKVTIQGATVSIYQPQLESWTGNLLDAYTRRAD